MSPTRLTSLLALPAALLLAGPALGADPHAADHKSADHKAPEPKAAVVAKAAPADAMSHLKERLQEKLGATKIQEATLGTNELKVPSRTPTAPATRVARAAPDLERAVAEHRAGKAGHEAHWGYFGEGGPAAWGQLKPEFGLCATGTRQSPIDIRDGISVDLDPVKFDYRPSRKLPRQVDIPELESAAVVSLGMNCRGGSPPRAS